MTAQTTETTRPAGMPSLWQQMSTLVRMELLLLRRNMTATGISVITPLVLGILLISGKDYDRESGVARTAGILVMVAVFCVHHHITTAYAARRNEMVLKRLRAGIPSDRTILTGVASATVLVFLVQAALIIAYGVLVLDMPVPANPLTMLLAMLLGAGVLAAFGAAVSAVTRTSEAAMLTTLPTMVLFLMAPGVLIPLGELPKTVENIAAFGPMGPFTEILRTSWLGHRMGGGEPMSFVDTTVHALPWLGVLLVWLFIAAAVTTRFFRWEPRH